MKYFLKLIFLLSIPAFTSAQNMVLNGDLEQYMTCPNHYGEIDTVNNWMMPTIYGTTDYFNSCASNASHVSVPENLDCNSYQQAHSGNGYAAIINFSDNGVTYREYLEGTLQSPLAPGVCFNFEMYVSLVNCSRYASDQLSVYFSPTPIINVISSQNLNYVPQITNPPLSFITDTANWVHYSGNFTSQGGELYFIIGNFNNDQNTNRVTVNPSWYYPNNFVYIDDVSLSVCTGINDLEPLAMSNVSPSPATDFITISCSENVPSELIVFDIASRQLISKQFTQTTSLDVSALNKGVYIYEIHCKNGKIARGRFLKV